MADVRIGSPHTVGWQLRDSAGSLATAGVTASPSLYGPGSATVPTSGPTALGHVGSGVWSVTFPASAMTVAGLYKALAPTITYDGGAIILEDQVTLFTVGIASPAHRTLRDCMVDLAIELDDGLIGTSSANGTTTTLVDSARANSNFGAIEWVDSELLILEPGNVADKNPLTVTGYTPASGTFTWVGAINGATASGQDYLLLNLRGKGVPFQKLKRTILAAWRELSPVQYVSDEVNFTTDSTYRLAVPNYWLDVLDVQARYGTSGPWSDIAPAYRPYDPDARVINFSQHVGASRALRVTGAIACAEPDALTSVVQVPYGWLRDRVLGELLAQRPRREDQQRAAVHLARADRNKPRG